MSPRAFALLDAVVTVVALGFLVWLVYFHESPEGGAADSRLPTFNAIFNACAASLLVGGLWAIRSGRRRVHKHLMTAALVASSLFLINYIYYHFAVGDTKFQGTGFIRPFYFFVLISHIALSAVVFPAILWAFFLALTERIDRHRRMARFTWAGWMYVSVTGILVYWMLHQMDWN
ncbi:DUF420 domain-containing protein [Myxococcota bacterium]|nr:DUF420 domain-containing protein [Myxococcota bacterium]